MEKIKTVDIHDKAIKNYREGKYRSIDELQMPEVSIGA